MHRQYFHDLAAAGLRMPIGADLLLHEQPDPAAARFCGESLGRVLIQTAERFRTPLAFPLMDLRIEKEWLLSGLGVAPENVDTFHFDEDSVALSAAAIQQVLHAPPTPRMRASSDALAHVARHSALLPVGMCIGPFSLLTKLLADPISAVYQVAADPSDGESQAVLRLLDLASQIICAWIQMQIDHGARAVCVCEPAFNTVYISPRQMEQHPDILDTLVLNWNRRIKAVLDASGASLIFHDCGELNETILRSIAKLDPLILSLGSSCDLPTVAALIDKRTVLYGNLPSRKFCLRDELSEDEVRARSEALVARMKELGHPFILGTECDVLSVAGCECALMRKTLAMLGDRV